MDRQKLINGGIVVALGLLFVCSALVGLWEGEIYALRPSEAIVLTERPEAFERRVLFQLSVGLLCVVGGAGYLWLHRCPLRSEK